VALIPNNAGQAIALDAKTGRATQTARTTYLALLTAAPTATTTLATMSEVTTAGYSRQSVTWAAPSGNPRSTSNTNALTFGPFTADPPNITHCALVSAATGTTGDLIDAWSLDTARDGISGDSLTVAASALVLTQT
jgi:hypothetical protein